MKIIIDPQVLYRLMAFAAITRDEYSGFGFCRREGENIFVYDFVLLDVGSYVYTEIDPKRVLPLLQRDDRKNMKVWLHRHPMGNGIPGPHNWSGTDERTIRYEPLGSTPDAVSWSVSIVLTPKGFVGRIDNYIKGITQHLEVEPNTLDLFKEVEVLASQSPFESSTPRRGRKSKRSQEENVPALETSKVRKAVGRKRKKSKSSTPGEENPETSPVSMNVYGSYAGSTIRLQAALPTSAPTTALTGVGSETALTGQDNTTSGTGENNDPHQA